MTNDDFEQKYLPKYRNVIKALARKLAKRDQELFEDLKQVGMIALWQLDPAQATTNEDAWIRQALYNNMTNVLRRDRPKLYESLQAHLAHGDQLMIDATTGEPSLLLARQRMRFDLNEQDEDDDA